MKRYTALACQLAVLAGLNACGTVPADQQAQIGQAVAAACTVDGAVVPAAQPLVATLGSGGATAAAVDAILVHPAVVAACKSAPNTASAGPPGSPAD